MMYSRFVSWPANCDSRCGHCVMYEHFGLVLMVNHASNVRCDCFTGTKFSRPMDYAIGARAIDRATASIAPGGVLELAFFGGEPLAEACLVLDFIDRARARTCLRDIDLRLNLITYGTQTSAEAWEVMSLPDLDLSIKHDGLPHIHDRHRRSLDGGRASACVEDTISHLIEGRKSFQVAMVVRPGTVDALANAVRHLRTLGVTRVNPSLDLWAHWTAADTQRLEAAIHDCATVWATAMPDFSVSWFDEKAAPLARVPMGESVPCGFGAGEIAVAPSGSLYRCERLIGDDAPDDEMRLDGHALHGEHFLIVGRGAAAAPSEEACDGLLCLFNQVCLSETGRVLQEVARTRAS